MMTFPKYICCVGGRGSSNLAQLDMNQDQISQHGLVPLLLWQGAVPRAAI